MSLENLYMLGMKESYKKIFYSKIKSDIIKNSISSILSGYVWDENNYFVKIQNRKIEVLVMSN